MPLGQLLDSPRDARWLLQLQTSSLYMTASKSRKQGKGQACSLSLFLSPRPPHHTLHRGNPFQETPKQTSPQVTVGHRHPHVLSARKDWESEDWCFQLLLWDWTGLGRKGEKRMENWPCQHGQPQAVSCTVLCPPQCWVLTGGSLSFSCEVYREKKQISEGRWEWCTAKSE